jgi:hypothetical protein
MFDTLHTCAVCGRAQPAHAFHKAQLNRRKRKPWCKTCCRDYQLAKKFKIGLSDYAAMLEGQGGCCKICGSDQPASNGKAEFCVDHDHRSGRVRGLLCNKCNIGLGAFKDSVDTLRRAIAYLEGA